MQSAVNRASATPGRMLSSRAGKRKRARTCVEAGDRSRSGAVPRNGSESRGGFPGTRRPTYPSGRSGPPGRRPGGLRRATGVIRHPRERSDALEKAFPTSVLRSRDAAGSWNFVCPVTDGPRPAVPRRGPPRSGPIRMWNPLVAGSFCSMLGIGPSLPGERFVTRRATPLRASKAAGPTVVEALFRWIGQALQDGVFRIFLRPCQETAAAPYTTW